MGRTSRFGRFLVARRLAFLALGDLVTLLLFAGASAARHGGTPLSIAETAVQFGLGWLLVATLAGAYGPRALAGWPRAALLGAGAWAVGAVVGSFVRAATEPGASVTPIFVLVTAGVGALLFGVWRAVAAKWL